MINKRLQISDVVCENVFLALFRTATTTVLGTSTNKLVA